MFERAIPSFSTQNVLTQYLRRIFTDLLRKEENGFESDYVSFLLSFKSSDPYLRYAFSLHAYLHYPYLCYASLR